MAAIDRNARLYWSSHPDAQHSRNVAQNGQAFIVFCDSIQGGLGLYLDTTVDMLTDQRIVEKALHLLTKRMSGVCAPLAEFLASEQRIYRAIPHRAWLSDVIHSESGAVLRDSRVEINLDELHNAIAVLDSR